jgi:phosphatidate cytidylyltransferase
MLKTRVLTAVVLLAAFLAALFLLPPAQWALLVALLTAMAGWEWARLAGLSGVASGVYAVALAVAAVAVLFVPTLTLGTGVLYWMATAFWVVIAPLALAGKFSLSAAAKAVAGWIVLLPTAAAMHQLRLESPALLLGFMATIWVSDTAAYFVGSNFGRRKLAPSISPGKTWEGVAGAMVAVAAYGTGWGLWGLKRVEPGRLALLVAVLLVLAVLGILGDLFESLLKRQAGAKDSGAILPGHGGILDRIDALAPVLPVAALAFTFL